MYIYILPVELQEQLSWLVGPQISILLWDIEFCPLPGHKGILEAVYHHVPLAMLLLKCRVCLAANLAPLMKIFSEHMPVPLTAASYVFLE